MGRTRALQCLAEEVTYYAPLLTAGLVNVAAAGAGSLAGLALAGALTRHRHAPIGGGRPSGRRLARFAVGGAVCGVLLYQAAVCARAFSVSYGAGKRAAQSPPALHAAAGRGDIRAVVGLLDHGADVNAQGGFGETALHWAAKQGRSEVVELLLSRGADPNAKTFTGDTALDLALRAHQNQVAAVLRAHGGKPGAPP